MYAALRLLARSAERVSPARRFHRLHRMLRSTRANLAARSVLRAARPIDRATLTGPAEYGGASHKTLATGWKFSQRCFTVKYISIYTNYILELYHRYCMLVIVRVRSLLNPSASVQQANQWEINHHRSATAAAAAATPNVARLGCNLRLAGRRELNAANRQRVELDEFIGTVRCARTWRSNAWHKTYTHVEIGRGEMASLECVCGAHH